MREDRLLIVTNGLILSHTKYTKLSSALTNYLWTHTSVILMFTYSVHKDIKKYSHVWINISRLSPYFIFSIWNNSICSVTCNIVYYFSALKRSSPVPIVVMKYIITMITCLSWLFVVWRNDCHHCKVCKVSHWFLSDCTEADMRTTHSKAISRMKCVIFLFKFRCHFPTAYGNPINSEPTLQYCFR